MMTLTIVFYEIFCNSEPPWAPWMCGPGAVTPPNPLQPPPPCPPRLAPLMHAIQRPSPPSLGRPSLPKLHLTTCFSDYIQQGIILWSICTVLIYIFILMAFVFNRLAAIHIVILLFFRVSAFECMYVHIVLLLLFLTDSGGVSLHRT